MTSEFKGRSVLVIGGAKGIGKAVVEAFAEHGAKVAIGYHSDADAGRRIAQSALTAGASVSAAHPVDVADAASVKSFFDLAESEVGPCEVVVLTAGRLVVSPVMELSDEAWAASLATNLTGAMYCLRETARRMVPRHRGRIIAFASMAGKSGVHPGVGAYAAAKGGVITLARSLAAEIAPFGVTVNVVAPALVETDMLAALPPERKQQMVGTVPVGRMGQPVEAAHAVLFLASDRAGFITGETLNVSGGRFMD
jgi:3-oxoacyl-[acyl-carrier protein] reductase